MRPTEVILVSIRPGPGPEVCLPPGDRPPTLSLISESLTRCHQRRPNPFPILKRPPLSRQETLNHADHPCVLKAAICRKVHRRYRTKPLREHRAAQILVAFARDLIGVLIDEKNQGNPKRWHEGRLHPTCTSTRNT